MQYSKELEEMARKLVASGRGILAADESTATIGKRLQKIGVQNEEEHRRAYRELLFTTPGIGEFISGAILYDETIRQAAADGKAFVDVMNKAGIVPGIKVDTGAKELAGSKGEKITEGLDGLRERIAEYYKIGARFAKWRAVITIGTGTPSDYCLKTNAHALARYAALCQEGGLVPIVEPEVLMDGDHSIERCHEVTHRALGLVFEALAEQRVVLENMLLKPNMVISGMACAEQADVSRVAFETLRCFRQTVPAAVPGIVFLSGGQSNEKATAHLNAMNQLDGLPWELSFSYGRALQAPALEAWKGRPDQVEAAQKALYHRAKMNSLARSGRYSDQLEKAA